MEAMLVDSGLLIYQTTSEGKKSEIKTFQAMLETLPVKSDPKSLHGEIAGYFHKVKIDDPARIIAKQISDLDGEHGRIVHRQYTMLPTDKWISGIDKWEGAQLMVEVVINQELEDKENTLKQAIT